MQYCFIISCDLFKRVHEPCLSMFIHFDANTGIHSHHSHHFCFLYRILTCSPRYTQFSQQCGELHLRKANRSNQIQTSSQVDPCRTWRFVASLHLPSNSRLFVPGPLYHHDPHHHSPLPLGQCNQTTFHLKQRLDMAWQKFLQALFVVRNLSESLSGN